MHSEGVVDHNIIEAGDDASNLWRWRFPGRRRVMGSARAVKTQGEVGSDANMFDRTCSVLRFEEPLCVDSC